MGRKKWSPTCGTENIYSYIPEVLKKLADSPKNLVLSCPFRLEIIITNKCECYCFFNSKSNIIIYLMVLNAAQYISGTRTKILENIGVGDVVGMVICNMYSIMACPYPDLPKNSMFGQEGDCLCRQNFDPNVLNNCKLQPTLKQQQNLNMNNSRQHFIFHIQKTGLKLHDTGCDL